MTVRPLRLLGDPVLRTACDPVTKFDDALAQLVQDLLDTVQEPGRAWPRRRSASASPCSATSWMTSSAT